MIDPTNTLGTKLHRDAKAFEKIKSDLAPMLDRLELFDKIVIELRVLITAVRIIGLGSESNTETFLENSTNLLRRIEALPK